jgi:hypothetical protein
MDNDAIKTILLAVKQVEAFARIIDPDIDHVSMYAIDNGADFTAWAGNNESISAHMFKDGSFRIGDDFYKADGTFDFSFKGDEKAC